jgi:exopolysaccharide biosynthesis protein
VEIPARGFVLVAGRTAEPAKRTLLLSLKRGDRVDVHLALAPFHPIEAVGGRPMLARDSVIVAEVETEGQASFRARNPRTALGIANRGRRLILVVIDGRQVPYSDGTTLRETAEIMLALGARDAINLDGGGSSALVYRDSTKAMRIANKPSDATGERPVGDAVAIVKGCGGRR